VADLRAQISLANTIGENEKAEWLKKVLILDNKTIAVDNQGPYSPQNYLNKGKTLEHSSFCSPNSDLITPWSRVLLEKLPGFQLVRKFPAFMEPVGSLPHSQVPATCPYPEPAQSSPYPHLPLPEDPS
jgi:hypothetical protein